MSKLSPGPYISDHRAVVATLTVKKDIPKFKAKLIRGTHKITDEQWQNEFNEGNVALTENLEESMQSLNTELQRVLAPEREKKVTLKTNHPWYDQDMKCLKQGVCKLEKKWLKY